jgi:hypothetical protein
MLDKKMIGLCFCFFSAQCMEQQTAKKPDDMFTISRRSLIERLGYYATTYLLNQWGHKTTEQQSHNTGAPDGEKQPTLPDQQPTQSSDKNRLELDRIAALPAEIQTRIGDDVLDLDLEHLQTVSYTPIPKIKSGYVRAFADFFDDNGNPIIITLILGCVVFYDLTDHQWFETKNRVPCQSPSYIAYHNENFAYSQHDNRTFFVSNEDQKEIPAFGDLITALALSDTMLACGNNRGNIRAYAIKNRSFHTGPPLISIEKHQNHSISSLALAPQTLCAGNTDGTIKLWDVRTMQLAQCITTHTKRKRDITSLLIQEPLPHYIRAGRKDGALITYDRRMLHKPVHHTNGGAHRHEDITHPVIALAQNGSVLFSATYGSVVRWHPHFECEAVHKELSCGEKIWIHAALKD